MAACVIGCTGCQVSQKRKELNWKRRVKIANGLAMGLLEYVHHDRVPRIVGRTSNPAMYCSMEIRRHTWETWGRQRQSPRAIRQTRKDSLSQVLVCWFLHVRNSRCTTNTFQNPDCLESIMFTEFLFVLPCDRVCLLHGNYQ